MRQNQIISIRQTSAISIERALSLQQAGKFEEAGKQYKKILKRDPNNIDALHFMGVLAFQIGRISSAFDYLNRAIKAAPRFPEALNSRGLIYEKISKNDDALDDYNKALSINPMLIDALYNRGSLQLQQTNFETAKIDFDKILEIQPDHISARLHRALAFKGMKDHLAALSDFNHVILKKPETYSALNNRGSLLNEMGRANEALKDLSDAIRLDPDTEEAYITRGNCYSSQRKYAKAIEDFSRALEINPKSVTAFNNRGSANLDLGSFDNAITDFKSALEIVPRCSDTWNNLGTLYKDINMTQKAIEAYEKAISLSSENADAQFGKSLTLLKMGNFEEGWHLYEWRKNPNRKNPANSANRKYEQPLWLGRESIIGKTLFLYWEQGFGDTIQFCRLAKQVSDLGCKVILEVQEQLKDLMTNVDGVDELVQSGQPIPEFDFHCPLMSLPYALGLKLEDVKADSPYLGVDEIKLDIWKRKLGPKCGPRVGIVWSGNKTHSNDHNRSIRLEALANGITAASEFYSIQKEIRQADVGYLASSKNIHHFGDDLHSFADTAALVDLMDVIVTVDTSVAHLAGAIGKKVFLILPYTSDFRWLLNTNETPWYPEMKLFRQDSSRDWSRVLQAVDEAIAKLVN